MAGLADHEGLAPFSGHEHRPLGLTWAGLGQAGEGADLVDDHPAGLLAQLAPPFQEPGDQFLTRVGCPVGDAVGEGRGPIPNEGYPTEPCDQRLLAGALDASLEARALSMRCDDGGPVPGCRLRHAGLVLGGKRFQHRRLGGPTQSFESPDVGGKQVVLDDAPVFGPVGVDDVVVVEVLQGTAMRGFAAPQVGAHLAVITSRGTRSAIIPLADRRPWVILLSACCTMIS